MDVLVAPHLTSPKRGGTEELDDLAFFCKLEAGKYKIAVIRLLRNRKRGDLYKLYCNHKN